MFLSQHYIYIYIYDEFQILQRGLLVNILRPGDAILDVDGRSSMIHS